MDRLRILVLGYIVRGPLAGMAWHVLQFPLGLLRLGHDVYFLEDSEDWGSCYDPSRGVTDADPTYGLRFAQTALEQNDLGERWAYYDAHTDHWHGPCADRIDELCGSADLLLNVSGVNPIRPWLAGVPHRAYIDTDPAFEQVRQINDPHRQALRQQHTAFFTFGANIPGGNAKVPDDGVPWQATRQPVVLDRWPVEPGPAAGRFTTVMQWDSYPAREHGEFRFAMKSESFEPYFDLPRSCDRRMEVALSGAGAPLNRLQESGWQTVDAVELTLDLPSYQDYLRASKAEFSIAKHGYVVSGCGWFSERSANYLASGRPVIAQDTGFQTWLPTGRGLLAFSSPDEAAEAIEAIDRDYSDHCHAARQLAEDYFDSNRVLGELVESAMRGVNERREP